MAPEVFHLFPLLPPEIRHEIYLLATPPRIVDLMQHSEGEDEFIERFNSLGPAGVELPPYLAYSALNWYDRIWPYEDFCAQPRLEEYGFTSSKRIQYPWMPTHTSPEIPIDWLLDHPDVAYQLLRKTSLYSKAPIPSLLHTCAESRKILVSAGYRLAFGSRNHEPRTWFHYKKDVLYLGSISKHENSNEPNVLDNGPWDIEQLDINSLRKVRNLALAGGGVAIGLIPPNSDVIHGAISLLPRLEKLYLVEWDKEDFGRFSQGIPASRRPRTDTKQASVPYKRELWRCIPVEEIDALFNVAEGYQYRLSCISCIGYEGQALMDFEGLSGEYFQFMTEELVRYLVDDEDRTWEFQGGTVNRNKQTPTVELVHVCKESVAKQLFKDRQKLWEHYSILKERHARRDQAGRTQSSRFTSPGSQHRTETVSDVPISPTDLQWEDDWEAFNEARLDERVSYDEDDRYMYNMDDWVEQGRIVRPRQVLTLKP
ncbi:hypothetical protein GGS26DRAFT_173425 [Hypomontagnella submonticulosa]|nr:hypothetical protein GGS26DRAFT_173425 [Hypomontagnella submonticulosa]